MRLAHSILVVSASAALVLHSPLAAAQDVAAAEALFTKGVADMEAGRFDTACPAIQESHRLDPRAGTLFTLAECEAQQGRIATAIAHYNDYLALLDGLTAAQQAKHQDRKKIAEQQRATLGPQVPRLTLLLPPGAPAGTVVTRDGVALSAPSLGVPLPVDPGEHIIVAQLPGGAAPTEFRITLANGEQRELSLSLAEPPPPPRPAPSPPLAKPRLKVETPPEEPSVSSRRIGTYVAGGLGLAGLAVGGITGGLVLGKKGFIDERCDHELKTCDSEGKQEIDAAQRLGLVSTIGFGVGLAGVGAAVILLVTEPSQEEPGAAGARVRPVVNVAGSRGALVGLGGRW